MRPARDIKKIIQDWNESTSTPMDEKVLADMKQAAVAARERPAPDRTDTRRRNFWGKAGYLVAASLVIVSWSVSLVFRERLTNLHRELEVARRTIDSRPPEDSATINLYLTEHEQAVVQKASLNTTVSPPLQMRFDRGDMLYYERYAEPESMQPGLIFRGPPSRRDIEMPKSPAISNGHTLTRSEARQAADFELVCPAWLRPCYRLEEIRTIEDRDALQMLYTDGISSVSLFEQPLNGQRGLGPQDFREYVVYQNDGKAGGAILSWRDNARLYVLVGNAEISQLMDMAQSISAAR